MGNAFAHYFKPEVTPGPDFEPSFDPLEGFPNGRKKRVMNATIEEMQSAKVNLKSRDYCADKLLQYSACRADVFPFVYKCHHEKHAYLTCEYEDYVMRMKEYERERRLLKRQQKLTKMEANPA